MAKYYDLMHRFVASIFNLIKFCPFRIIPEIPAM